MMLFAGDTILCINSKDVIDYITEGKYYVVLMTDVMYNESVVKIKDDKGNHHFFRENRFEFIEEFCYT